MASSPPTAHQHCAVLSRVGSSKTQSALAKIIAIISAAPSPPPPPPRPEPDDLPRDDDPEAEGGRTARQPAGEPCFGLDLRLRLGPSPQIGGGSVEGDGGPTEQSGVVDASALAESACHVRAAEKTASEIYVPMAALEEQSLSPAVSVAGGGDVLTAAKSSEGECDPEEESHEETAGEDAKEKAFAEQKETKGSGGVEVGTTTANPITAIARDRGSLDLLLEAVRQVSGGLFDDDEGPATEKAEPAAVPAPEGELAPRKRRSDGDEGGGKKQRNQVEEWCIPFDLYEEETAPIVRSKRGRNQALPSRYRDSILDPWKKPPAISRSSRGNPVYRSR
ncbi:hypothetical protein Cni_G10333 [Canna indica]|uniref:Uncharacterized protein n=1 Tax=Canna indica TaxID=4628 RepID=A0AAQ3K9P9_9LILI|nr:hypothetical protein Cni_G10333 [Canna indica]